ncbi:complex I intermediate-associated protein 30-domain-containing protein [Staphylotrichum tortipilum]|uniref:Complex I intermediate-associated protein 30-domain-containing protein n=1 Tax=Staphylotrichum tortipilum TaxID=2831512 RepID=A0AAN6RVH9_9PEZI|nr:complex I intermediate-associated protein 30-domain-containing protein [Staphylotrichum longicolle]
MQATRPLLFKGFVGRSIDEFKRLSKIVFNLEGIKGAQGPYELHSFRSPTAIQDCKVMSDRDIGGISQSKLEWVASPHPSSGIAPPSPHSPGFARFSGNISNQLPKNRPEVHRTGYAAFRTRDRPPTIFGRSVFNIDPYVYLALRVKSDGRSYFVNVQTESIVPTDLHQHRLFVKKPGEWETVLIKWNDFVRTNLGYVVEPQAEILRQKVRSIGIGLTDRVPGPFELFIERMWATNDETEADSVVDLSTSKSATAAQAATSPAVEGKLKTKQGQKVAWTRE